jgi:serine/threonine-protein kinase
MKKRAIFICVDVYKSIGDDAIDNEIELLERYVNQFSGNGNLVMSEYLADAYARKAKTDEATSDLYYEKSLSIFKSIYESGYVTYQLQENIAIIYESLGEFDEAEKLLLQMAADYPKRYEPYKRLAYLEADKQQLIENADRDYRQMQEYYNEAVEKYSGNEQDMEMDMLDNMMQELRDGGWL